MIVRWLYPDGQFDQTVLLGAAAVLPLPGDIVRLDMGGDVHKRVEVVSREFFNAKASNEPTWLVEIRCQILTRRRAAVQG